MKFIACADIHGDLEAIGKIQQKIDKHKAEFVVCAGDHTFFGMDEEMILEKLNNLTVPVYLIHGNHEEISITKELLKEYKNIIWFHNSILTHNNVRLLGFGGGGFSPTEPGFRKFLKKQTHIFVTHQPPYDTILDDLHNGFSEKTGNVEFRQFIDEKQPFVAISGHIHESAGMYDHLGKTLIINPGPQGRVIEIDPKQIK